MTREEISKILEKYMTTQGNTIVSINYIDAMVEVYNAGVQDCQNKISHLKIWHEQLEQLKVATL